MIRLVGFSIAILAAAATLAFGQCSATTTVVATPAVIATPVVQAVQFVPVFVPTYAAGYQSQSQPQAAPAAASATPSSCDKTAEVLGELLKEIRTMRTERIPAPMPPGPPSGSFPTSSLPPTVQQGLKDAAAPVAPKGRAFVARCAQCHDKSAVDAKGMDPSLVFFVNQEPVPLTAQQAYDCLDDIARGRMPKGGKLSDDEFAEIQDKIRSQRTASAK